jgi:hypothetical protein
MWKRLNLLLFMAVAVVSLVAAAEEVAVEAPAEDEKPKLPDTRATPHRAPVETLAEDEKPRLGVDLSTNYVSRYIWRGYDVFDDHAALQPSANFDLFGSGFSVNVWGSLPMGSGYEDLSELDYTIAYGVSYFEEEKYALDVSANYIYYDFYKVKSKGADTEEVGICFALPKLLEIGGGVLVPKYYVGKLWPVDGADDIAGIYHSFSLSYDVTIPSTEQVLSFYSDINYNDGLFGADSDWSHATFGVSTSVEAGCVSITPFLNYQVSMEDTVNDEDELYGGVSVSMSF